MFETREINGEFAIVATRPIVLRTAGLDDDRRLNPGDIEFIERNELWEIGLAGEA